MGNHTEVFFGHFMDLGNYAAACNTARMLTKGLRTLEAWLAPRIDASGCCSEADFSAALQQLDVIIGYDPAAALHATAQAAVPADDGGDDDDDGDDDDCAGDVGYDVDEGDDGWYGGVDAAFLARFDQRWLAFPASEEGQEHAAAGAGWPVPERQQQQQQQQQEGGVQEVGQASTAAAAAAVACEVVTVASGEGSCSSSDCQQQQTVEGQVVMMASGQGRSIKEAKQEAAAKLIYQMRADNLTVQWPGNGYVGRKGCVCVWGGMGRVSTNRCHNQLMSCCTPWWCPACSVLGPVFTMYSLAFAASCPATKPYWLQPWLG